MGEMADALGDIDSPVEDGAMSNLGNSHREGGRTSTTKSGDPNANAKAKAGRNDGIASQISDWLEIP